MMVLDMQITVSAGRKLYRRTAGALDESRDFFQSETLTLSDELNAREIMLMRINLMERLEAAVDVHIIADGCLTLEQVQHEASVRRVRLETLRESFK